MQTQIVMAAQAQHGVSQPAASRCDIAQLRTLLILACELSQVDDLTAALHLLAEALSELTYSEEALLMIGGEAPLWVILRCDGSVHRPSHHPWQAVAEAGMRSAPAPHGTTNLCVLAVPQPHPLAILVTEESSLSKDEKAKADPAGLEAALELTAATLGRIQIRCSLERQVSTQCAQMAGKAQEHADELALRDLAARDMLALSLTDALTGLNNRRGFFARAEPLFRLAQRQQRGSAVVYADIDGLKTVNDTLGHAMGDQMIRDAATVIGASLRDADVLARLGGDEFVVYALDDAQPHALLLRLQKNLDAFNFLRQRPYHLAVSVGMVSCGLLGNPTLSDFIQQADRAMYEQKRGRPH